MADRQRLDARRRMGLALMLILATDYFALALRPWGDPVCSPSAVAY